MELRKKVLGVEKLHMYDIYTPLVSEVEASYSYEEAKDLVLKGLEALGGEYLGILKGAFEEGWVDVYEN